MERVQERSVQMGASDRYLEPGAVNGNARQEDEHTHLNTHSYDQGRELNSLKTLLIEQEAVFRTEQMSLETRKQTAKERVTDLFESFRKLLVEKETELLDKIDSEYSISGSLYNIESDRQRVDDIASGVERETNIEQVRGDIYRNIEMRNDILNRIRVPYLALKEDSINIVKNLSFGEFYENIPEENHETESDNDNVVNEAENIQEPDNNVVVGNNTNVASMDDNNKICEQDERGNNLADNCADENGHFDDKERGACGTTGEVRLPTAPPAEQEESPPPYWQAMGLEQPHSDERSVVVPGYYDIPHSPVNQLPDTCNKLQLWHSFPIRRQHDRREPLAVGLTWNHDRICLVDRANNKIKFFLPNGHLLAEMDFCDTEIRDVAFLEECRDESRYAVTSPKSRDLMIISIDACHVTKIINKLTFKQQYSCVSRGPKEQTLLGAEVAQIFAQNIVNIFTFTGQILFTIAHTPSFNILQYIKSVKVFGNKIIFLDWKLHSISVFDDNGQSLGEYRGTPNFPLINPLDMTLDNKGNILILNKREFSNIHVIDQHCNLVEIIKLPGNVSNAKLISFDTDTQKLAMEKDNGAIAIFTFENGYDFLLQRNLRQILE
jgi:hypothetical protein